MDPALMLSTAIEIAARAHKNQLDKGGNPYILHPLAVMNMLVGTTDLELMAIAILHDVVEDQGLTFNQLMDLGMSSRVINGIEGMTKRSGESVNGYLERILGNIDVVQVKLADLRHNSDLLRLKGVTGKDLDRANKYMYMFYMLSSRLKQGCVPDISMWVQKYDSVKA